MLPWSGRRGLRDNRPATALPLRRYEGVPAFWRALGLPGIAGVHVVEAALDLPDGYLEVPEASESAAAGMHMHITDQVTELLRAGGGTYEEAPASAMAAAARP